MIKSKVHWTLPKMLEGYEKTLAHYVEPEYFERYLKLGERAQDEVIRGSMCRALDMFRSLVDELLPTNSADEPLSGSAQTRLDMEGRSPDL